MIASELRPGIDITARRAWGRDNWFAVAILITFAVLRSVPKFFFVDTGDNSVLGEVVFGGIYIYAAFRLYALRDRAREVVRRSVPLLLFLGLTLASFVWSQDPFTTFKDAAQLVGTTLVGWYLVTRFTLSEFLRIAAVAFTALSVTSVLLIFGSPARGRMDWGAGPYSGVFAEKNGLGAGMALAFLTVVLLVPRSKGRDRFVLIGVAVIAVGLLVGSNSVTALLDCAGTAVIALAARAGRYKKYGLFAAMLGLVAFGAVVLASFAGFDSSSFFEFLGRNPNLTGRTELWPLLVRAIGDRPLLGFGYENFFQNGPYEDYLSDFLLKYNWLPPHAHDSFLQISLDTGLIGLALFLAVLGSALWRGAKLLWHGKSAMEFWPFVIVVYLVLGSYDETYFAQQNTLEWIFFLAALLYPVSQMRNADVEVTAPPQIAPRRFRTARYL